MFLLATWLFRSHLVFQDYQTVSISALCWGVSFFVRESVARPFQTPVSAKFHSLAVMEILELMNSDVERWISGKVSLLDLNAQTIFRHSFFLLHDLLFRKFPSLLNACWVHKCADLASLQRVCLIWGCSLHSCGIWGMKNGESTLVLVMLVISTCGFEGEISPWSTTIPLRRSVEFSNGGNDAEMARCS